MKAILVIGAFVLAIWQALVLLIEQVGGRGR